MKLAEAIQKVIKNSDNETSADIDDFSRAVDADIYIGWNQEWDNRVKGYWLVRWLCTDTWVGRKVYFFDDKPIAVGYQSARKNDEYIEFLNNESAEKIRAFIFELYGENQQSAYDIANQDEDIEDFYNFDLTDYFLEDKGFIENQPVKIIQRSWWENQEDKKWGICYHCKVQFENGEERVVKAEEVHFPIRVEKD